MAWMWLSMCLFFMGISICFQSKFRITSFISAEPSNGSVRSNYCVLRYWTVILLLLLLDNLRHRLLLNLWLPHLHFHLLLLLHHLHLRILLCMHFSFVLVSVSFLAKCYVTESTIKRFFSCMASDMIIHCWWRAKKFGAIWTLFRKCKFLLWITVLVLLFLHWIFFLFHLTERWLLFCFNIVFSKNVFKLIIFKKLRNVSSNEFFFKLSLIWGHWRIGGIWCSRCRFLITGYNSTLRYPFINHAQFNLSIIVALILHFWAPMGFLVVFKLLLAKKTFSTNLRSLGFLVCFKAR